MYGNVSTGVRSLRTGWSQVKALGRGYVMAHMTDKYPHERLMQSIEPTEGFQSIDDLLQVATDLLKETCIPYERALVENIDRYPQKDRRKLQAVIYTVHTLGNVRGAILTIGRSLFQPMTESLIRQREPDKFSMAFLQSWERVL